MEEDNVDPAQEMLNEGAPPANQVQPIDYQKMFEAQQAQMQQVMQQNAQLAQTVQQVAARPVIQQAPVNQPDPFAAFNPETAAALKAALEQQNQQFKQTLQQQEQRFAGMALEQEAAGIAAMPGLNADQIKRAQDIFRGNRAKGIPINAAECVDVVIGQDFRAGKVNIGNRAPPATIPGGSRQPAPPKARPTNFDNMSRKQQIAHFESDDAIHNAPIQGFWENDD